MKKATAVFMVFMATLVFVGSGFSASEAFRGKIYQPGPLKPIDSHSRLKVGDKAPDFTLPSVANGPVSLSALAGKKNVVISFVPAAWTPVCSDQWPGYNILKAMFDENDSTLLGITVDNIPTLFAWTSEMGKLWFPVLSDFWPHGETARKYGILRSDGVAERALFLIDKQGIIRYIDIHDINQRPDLEALATAMKELK